MSTENDFDGHYRNKERVRLKLDPNEYTVYIYVKYMNINEEYPTLREMVYYLGKGQYFSQEKIELCVEKLKEMSLIEETKKKTFIVVKK